MHVRNLRTALRLASLPVGIAAALAAPAAAAQDATTTTTTTAVVRVHPRSTCAAWVRPARSP